MEDTIGRDVVIKTNPYGFGTVFIDGVQVVDPVSYKIEQKGGNGTARLTLTFNHNKIDFLHSDEPTPLTVTFLCNKIDFHLHPDIPMPGRTT